MSDNLGSLVERAQQRVGTFLRGDKYAIRRVLGVGAMGAVFEATHRNGSRVAVKVLHPELSSVHELRSRFLREGYIANRVPHPGIVRIIDDDVDEDGSTFLVMELLHGQTLGSEWEAAGKRLAPARVAIVADAVLDVLVAIHAEGIVHRDVKPDNVFVSSAGFKLLDLGIARLTESPRLTATGQMMGTPEFAAPEQAGGHVREIDARSDVYSVGALMFALLTGETVHAGRTSMETMIFAATRPARSLFDAWANPPPALANVVDKALAFDKNGRWRSAAEMRVALRNATGLPTLAEVAPPEPATVAAPAPQLSTASPTVLVGRLDTGDEGAIVPLVRRAPKDGGWI